MVREVSIPQVVDGTPEGLKRWVREAATVLNEALRQLSAGGALYVWDQEKEKCITVPTSTTISGAEELTFESTFAGTCTLLITIVGAEGGVHVALNGTDLTEDGLTNADTSSEIIYDVVASNLVVGINSFKIWSTTSDAADLKRLEVRGVGLGGFNAQGALASEDILAAGVQIYQDGEATARALANGLAVLDVTDGQSVTFSPARANVPDIFFLSGGAGQPTGTMATATNWYPEVTALNSTTSGFDVSARFKAAPGSPTNQTETGATGSSSTNWVIEKTPSAEANDDTYTYQYDVTIQEADVRVIEGEETILPSTITVAFDTRTTAMGAWTERDTQVYSNSDPDNDEVKTNLTKDITVDGLGADAAFRVRVKSTTRNGGTIESFDQVTYQTGGSGGSDQSMTPGNGEQSIKIAVFDGSEGTIE